MIDYVIPILVALGVVAIFLVAIVTARLVPQNSGALTSERLTLFEHRLGTMENRVGSTEHDVKNIRMAMQGLATKDAVNSIAVQMGEVRGELKAVNVSTTQMNHSLERVEGYLIETAAKKIAGIEDTGRGHPT